MSEWLILLLLVPAIVVPVVLLVGFAGCSIDRTGTAVADATTPNLSVSAPETRITTTTITLELDYAGPAHQPVQRLRISRTQESTGSSNFFNLDQDPPSPSVSTSFEDSGLQPATRYRYDVFAIDASSIELACAFVIADTEPLQMTFYQTLGSDDDNWASNCLVQRLDATLLRVSGTPGGGQVRLTLRAGSAGSASIDRIYISKPLRPGAGDAFDSADDLAKVYDIDDGHPRIVVPMGATVVVPVPPRPGAAYYLDEAQPLLIAVDFSPGPDATSNVGYTNAVTPEQAVAYYKLEAGAANPTRTGYSRWPEDVTTGGIYLIERIEVG